MYAPFEKGYSTPVESWPDNVLRRADFIYRTSANRYVELALAAAGHNQIVELARTAIRLEKQANNAAKLLAERN